MPRNCFYVYCPSPDFTHTGQWASHTCLYSLLKMLITYIQWGLGSITVLQEAVFVSTAKALHLYCRLLVHWNESGIAGAPLTGKWIILMASDSFVFSSFFYSKSCILLKYLFYFSEETHTPYLMYYESTDRHTIKFRRKKEQSCHFVVVVFVIIMFYYSTQSPKHFRH